MCSFVFAVIITFRRTPAGEILVAGLLKGFNVKDFEIVFDEKKGRGVQANRDFLKGEFVLEYEAYKVYPMYVLD